MKKWTNQGQSLLEVLIALGVLVLVVIALMGATTDSLRNVQFSRDKALATRYVQEAVETYRTYRNDSGWSALVSGCETKGTIWSPSLPTRFDWTVDCYIPDTGLPPSACDAANSTCEVALAVTWTSAGQTHQSSLTTRFTDWQEN